MRVECGLVEVQAILDFDIIKCLEGGAVWGSENSWRWTVHIWDMDGELASPRSIQKHASLTAFPC